MTSRNSDSAAAAAAALDVPEIDVYLGSLLVPRFNSILIPLGIHLPGTTINSIIHAFIICFMSADTPATIALGLKVKGKTSRRILAYAFLSTVIPTTYRLFVAWHDRALRRLQQTDNMTSLEIRALHRKCLLSQRIIDVLKRTVPWLNFVVLMCWWAARVPSPTTSMIATGLTFATLASPHDLNVSYAHRRWIYDLLLRSVQLTSPVRSFDDLMGIVGSMISPIRVLLTWVMRHQHEDRCTLCHACPVVVPCFTNCNHLYCYTCLWTALAQRTTMPCGRCGQQVTHLRR